MLFIKEYYQTVFQQDFNGKPKLIISDMWAMLAAVSAGFGITIMPSYFVEEHLANKKVEILYQTKNAPSHYFYIGWKQGALRDPKVKMVYDLYKNACQQN